MPRIRTIKPEFWTDEKVVQLPFRARLFFIGMWNFADDDGCLLNEPERIKMQIFPGDSVDVEALVDLLSAAEMIDVFDLPDGRSVIVIPKFARHQKISHATPSSFQIEKGHKRSMPSLMRQAVAAKYGCKPGTTLECQCHYCDAPGQIIWWRRRDGRPSGWVSFSGVEISETIPESTPQKAVPIPEFSGNHQCLVLACKFCNPAKVGGSRAALFVRISKRNPERSLSIPESSLQISAPFRPEGKGREGKGRERTSVSANALTASPDGVANGSQNMKEPTSLFPSSNETGKSYTPPQSKPPSPDDRTWLFNEGLVWLAEAQGRTPKAMRSSVGNWLKQCGDDAAQLRPIFEDAAKLIPADPTAWITKAIETRTHQKPNGGSSTNGKVSLAEYDDNLWRARVGGFLRNNGFWLESHGPPPTHPDTLVPHYIVDEFKTDLAKIPKKISP